MMLVDDKVVGPVTREIEKILRPEIDKGSKTPGTRTQDGLSCRPYRPCPGAHPCGGHYA